MLGFYDDFSIRRTREKRFWYYKNNSFEPSRSFHIKLSQDAVLVPKYIHMASQNAPKSGLGGVLQPSWRPLGPSWKHHEASWGHLGASRTYLGASWAILEASWRRLGAPKSTESVGSGRVRGAVADTQRPLLRIPSGRIRIFGKGNIRK